jgi:ABC-type metal ion transport system substrate-binding protein
VAGATPPVERLLDARDCVSNAKHLVVGAAMAAQAPTMLRNERAALCAILEAARSKLEETEAALDQLVARPRQRRS